MYIAKCLGVEVEKQNFDFTKIRFMENDQRFKHPPKIHT